MKSSTITICITFLYCSVTACFFLAPSRSGGTSLGKCYHRSRDSIEIRYRGGYPRSKLVRKKVNGAEPKSFHLIADVQDDNCGLSPLYGADDKQVFFRNKLIPGAEPVSFAALGSGYGRDRSSLYYHDRIIAGVSSEGFRLVSIPYSTASYGVTSSAVLYRDKPILAPVESATFQALGGLWVRDAQHVYLHNRIEAVQGADPQSFTVLLPRRGKKRRNLAYAKDRNRVYRVSADGVMVLEGANPGSFERLNSNYCRDRASVFYKGIPVKGAHAPSFHIPKSAFGHTGVDRYGKIHLGRRIK